MSSTTDRHTTDRHTEEQVAALRAAAGVAGASVGITLPRPRPALDPLDPLAELNADLDELQEYRRDANRAAAAQYRIAARIVLRSGASPKEKNATPFFRHPSAMEWRALRAEIALVLHVGEPTAEKILGYAPILVNDLPRTMAAFSEGRISESNARTLAQESVGLTPSERAEFEDVALPLAEKHAPAMFAKRVRAERDKRRPEGAEERAKKAAVTDAGVWLDHAPDGRAYLSANIDAVDGSAAFDRLATMATAAKNTPGETRGTPELRAAAFTDLLLNGIGTDGAGTGISGQVAVTVPALSLLGESTDLAHLAGHGPIDVATAATLLAETGSFTRVITDPTTGDVLAVDRKRYRTGARKADAGTTADMRIGSETGIGLAAFSRLLTEPVTGSVLAAGRTRYRPPEDMQRWVRLRDGVCMFPNCTRPAMRCELDHVQEWHRDNGTTDAANLCCLCSGHHALKTLTGWCPVAIGGGVIEWTSPAGRVYREEPAHRMEPIAGLDVVSPDTVTSNTANTANMSNTATAGAAPIIRATDAAHSGILKQRLFSDPPAEWIATIGGGDPGDGDSDGYSPEDEGDVPPPEWQPDLGDPPPDPPIDAYFPNGLPGSVLIAMLEQGTDGPRRFDDAVLQRQLRDYARLEQALVEEIQD